MGARFSAANQRRRQAFIQDVDCSADALAKSRREPLKRESPRRVKREAGSGCKTLLASRATKGHRGYRRFDHPNGRFLKGVRRAPSTEARSGPGVLPGSQRAGVQRGLASQAGSRVKQESSRIGANDFVRGITMQKLVSLAFSTLSTTSQAFIQGHFRQAQRRVRREAVHGEPQVVNWEAASLEILQSATAYCAEGDEACDVEQLIDIKSALEGRAAGLEESAAAYADVVEDAEAYGDAYDVSGATAEDRALARYVRGLKRQGLRARRRAAQLDASLIERS